MCKAIVKGVKRCHFSTEQYNGYCKKHARLISNVSCKDSNDPETSDILSDDSHSGFYSIGKLPLQENLTDEDFAEQKFQKGLDDMEKYIKLGRMKRQDLYNLICNDQFSFYQHEDEEIDHYFIHSSDEVIQQWFMVCNHETLIDKLMKFTNIRTLLKDTKCPKESKTP